MKYEFKDYLKLNPLPQSPTFALFYLLFYEEENVLFAGNVKHTFLSLKGNMFSLTHKQARSPGVATENVFILIWNFLRKLSSACQTQLVEFSGPFPPPPYHPVQNSRTQKIITALWLKSHHVNNEELHFSDDIKQAKSEKGKKSSTGSLTQPYFCPTWPITGKEKFIETTWLEKLPLITISWPALKLFWFLMPYTVCFCLVLSSTTCNLKAKYKVYCVCDS